MMRCRTEPYSREVFDQIAEILPPRELSNFFRDLARDDERQAIGVARAFAISRMWDLCILQYRKALQKESQPDLVEELAVALETCGRQNEADKVRAGNV